jgi:hypothetical protein
MASRKVSSACDSKKRKGTLDNREYIGRQMEMCGIDSKGGALLGCRATLLECMHPSCKMNATTDGLYKVEKQRAGSRGRRCCRGLPLVPVELRTYIAAELDQMSGEMLESVSCYVSRLRRRARTVRREASVQAGHELPQPATTAELKDFL